MGTVHKLLLSNCTQSSIKPHVLVYYDHWSKMIWKTNNKKHEQAWAEPSLKFTVIFSATLGPKSKNITSCSFLQLPVWASKKNIHHSLNAKKINHSKQVFFLGLTTKITHQIQELEP